jgi:hypothetical protein
VPVAVLEAAHHDIARALSTHWHWPLGVSLLSAATLAACEPGPPSQAEAENIMVGAAEAWGTARVLA